MSMRRPISLKIFSITLVLLILMVAVTWLSVFNLRLLNNQVRALADYYLPLQQQVASVEILVRQQMVHMERIVAGMAAARPDAQFLATESTRFDARGVNADQIVDSSIRQLNEALAAKDIALDRAALAALAQQLPDIQTARMQFHARFREYQIEAASGTPSSAAIVRDALARQKDALDSEIEKSIDALNQLTSDTAANAKHEEQHAIRLNWIITAIATVLGLIFAWRVTSALVEPIRRLVRGTRAVEDGDLDVEIDIRTRDELASLGDSFNHMVLGLREKERIRETFGHYVDPRIVQGLLDNQLSEEGGQRREMSVFFSDLVGFTRLVEGLSADAAVRFLNRYFALMADEVRAESGIIDKYIGDSVMAFWGAPFTDETTHAERCCAAALRQLERLDEFQQELPALFQRPGQTRVDVRMGLATGDVTVGNIGSDTSRGFTVIGDTVNLASRLEQANKFYGTRILVSEATRRAAGGRFIFREIDRLRVLGKNEPVGVYELMGFARQASADQTQLVQTFESALAQYRAQNWEAATAGFQACLAIRPDDAPSRALLDRITAFRTTPPAADWDGVWVAQSK
ncbi:MAG: adenylate/guanylate cyclase domain-containing protein [Thiobacillus sp.]